MPYHRGRLGVPGFHHDRWSALHRAFALPFGQLLSRTAADLVRTVFATEELRYLAAPWTLQIGLAPRTRPGRCGSCPAWAP